MELAQKDLQISSLEARALQHEIQIKERDHELAMYLAQFPDEEPTAGGSSDVTMFDINEFEALQVSFDALRDSHENLVSFDLYWYKFWAS